MIGVNVNNIPVIRLFRSGFGDVSIAGYTIAHKQQDALMCKESGAGLGWEIAWAVHLNTVIQLIAWHDCG